MHHLQPSRPAITGSVPSGQPFPYGNQLAEPVTDLADQPLQFTPRFTRDQDSLQQPGYAHHLNPAASASVNTWTSSVVPDAVYPSVPSVNPPGPQVWISLSLLFCLFSAFAHMPRTFPCSSIPPYHLLSLDMEQHHLRDFLEQAFSLQFHLLVALSVWVQEQHYLLLRPLLAMLMVFLIYPSVPKRY